MCGRYYRRSDKQKIAEAFRTGLPTTFEILPSFNVAPQSFQPIVRRSKETDDRELVQMRWGLVPFWILLANSPVLFRSFCPQSVDWVDSRRSSRGQKRRQHPCQEQNRRRTGQCQ